jgi:hypothetical protein
LLCPPLTPSPKRIKMGSQKITCAEEDTLVTLERKMAPQKEAKRMPTNASKVDIMVMDQQ